MKLPKRLSVPVVSLLFSTGMIWLSGCAPMGTAQPPSLNEVRSGTVRGPSAEDRSLRPGEMSAEIDQIDPARREIRVITGDGRKDLLRYDPERTRVTYHGWDYYVADLEAGDRIAYQTPPRSPYVDSIRLQEPLQARGAPNVARREAARSRNDVVEGTVDRIDYKLGVFDVRPPSGRTVTVSLPYNARAADVDSFRSLRRGDAVRVEGEFVNPDNLQLQAFLSSR